MHRSVRQSADVNGTEKTFPLIVNGTLPSCQQNGVVKNEILGMLRVVDKINFM